MEQPVLEENYPDPVIIRDAGCVYHEMRDIKCYDKEVFVGFFLDTKIRAISQEVVSVGTLI